MKTKVALITGSTRGIGFDIGEKLEKNGFNVIFNGKSQIKKKKNYFVKGDISKQKTLDKIDNLIKKNFSKLDLLINNVGFTKSVFI